MSNREHMALRVLAQRSCTVGTPCCGTTLTPPSWQSSTPASGRWRGYCPLLSSAASCSFARICGLFTPPAPNPCPLQVRVQQLRGGRAVRRADARQSGDFLRALRRARAGNCRRPTALLCTSQPIDRTNRNHKHNKLQRRGCDRAVASHV